MRSCFQLRNTNKNEPMETTKEHWVTEHITKIIVGLIVTTVFSMVVAAFNLYLTARISPLNEVDRSIQKDVQALFDGDTQRKIDHDKVLKIEEKIEGIESGIAEIKSDTRDIKNYLLK